MLFFSITWFVRKRKVSQFLGAYLERAEADAVCLNETSQKEQATVLTILTIGRNGESLRAMHRAKIGPSGHCHSSDGATGCTAALNGRKAIRTNFFRKSECDAAR
jgi:hypothetical protein